MTTASVFAQQEHLAARIRAEYEEMPGLKLTARQASRFWHLDPEDSERLLDTFVAAGLLRRTTDGHYLLLSAA